MPKRTLNCRRLTKTSGILSELYDGVCVCTPAPKVGGSQKGGFQKGGFGGCSPGTKTGTRVRSPKPPFWKPPFYLPITLFGVDKKGGFQKGGFGGCSPGTKTGTRVRSPKPPFYETALLSRKSCLSHSNRICDARHGKGKSNMQN